MLEAGSPGSAGHLRLLLPFLAAGERRGDERIIVGPMALKQVADVTDHPFLTVRANRGGVAPIRERLPVVAPREESVLANRKLFGTWMTCQ